ncbi:MAG TPA: M48 family peptidase [Ignavibacteriales bacterium]|nr:M48 family peptidase [Ignavibacteriales bacterium]
MAEYINLENLSLINFVSSVGRSLIRVSVSRRNRKKVFATHSRKLSFLSDQNIPLKISSGFFKLDKQYLNKAESVFKSFYKEKAIQKIKERLGLISERFDHRPNSIKVLGLKNRWASWSPKHNLHFHWKCAMAPVPVLDYIITHEMVHLKYPNHSPAFWNELDKKMPNYRKYETWLKQNGVKMSL